MVVSLKFIKSCSIDSRNNPSPKSAVVYETKFSSEIPDSRMSSFATLATLYNSEKTRLIYLTRLSTDSQCASKIDDHLTLT